MLSNHRHIAHIDMDAFFISVEHLQNPALKGKPLLIGSHQARGVVAACSYEARQFGIHNAMPMRAALRLCKHAIVVKSDYEAYSKSSRVITDIIQETVPLYEKASIDEFYIDLSGMDKYFGCYQFTKELQQKIKKETGLPASYGLASNKVVSKVATNEVKPNGQIEIPFGTEKNFLAPLHILKLPGIGQETSYKLLKMGVSTVKILSSIPVHFLQNLLGKPGQELWRRAQGIDASPVIPYREQKSISTEETFEQDTIDIPFLHAALVRMTTAIGFELRSQQKLTGCITLKIKYTDMETHTKQKTIPYTNLDEVLLNEAKPLFTQLYERRQRIRLLGIRFTQLIPGHHQINLFENTQEQIHLYQAIDSIKHRFGEKFMMRGAALG